MDKHLSATLEKLVNVSVTDPIFAFESFCQAFTKLLLIIVAVQTFAC